MKPIFQDVIPPKHSNQKKTLHSIEVPVRQPIVRINDNVNTAQVDPQTKTPKEQKRFQDQIPLVPKNTNPAAPEKKPIDFVQRQKIGEQITIPSIKPEPVRRRGFPFKTLFTLSVIGMLGFLSYWFIGVRATVTITPKMKDVGVSTSYTAKLKPTANELAFSAITSDTEKEITVPATGKKKVETRATGKVVLYNTYSSGSQRLTKNTRIESAAGMIYRLDSSVMIPGKTKKGSEDIPGSVEVSITAEEAGDEYNSKPTDFTIPGFKGEPRYSKFYGRSKTPIEGGFSGTIKTASDEEIAAAESRVEGEITDELKKQALSQIPSGFVSFNNSIFITTEKQKTDDPTTIKMKGTIHVIIFEKAVIGSRIAKDSLNINDNLVVANKLDTLTFTPDPNETLPWETGNLPFTLTGTTTLVWNYDKNKLKEDLAGKPTKIIPTVLTAYPGIEKANVDLIPTWKSTMPTDPNRINIVDTTESGDEKTSSIFSKKSVPVVSTVNR